MIGYLATLRPIVFMASLLTIVSFKLALGDINKSLLPAITIIIIATATMAQNDYRDRFFDKKKGKTFAYNNSRKYLSFVLILWGLSCIFVLVLGLSNLGFGLLALTASVLGLIYSEIQKIPLAANLIVSVASANSTLFPLFSKQHDTKNVLFLFFATMSIIYAREILKDCEDVSVDLNKKWSLVNSWGQKNSILIASGFILITIIFLLQFRNATPSIPFLLSAFLMLLLVPKKIPISTIKWTIDIGMIIFLICALLFNNPI